jgi:6-pyruvoyltetrahydropterin/6-carboxytetrahydropterin synthase
MGLDFGFLKDIMMNVIDAPCDHGMIIWKDDAWLPDLMKSDSITHIRQQLDSGRRYVSVNPVLGIQTKLLIVPFIPTAEALARFWFEEMEGHVIKASGSVALLAGVEVWETPNCKAEFFAQVGT